MILILWDFRIDPGRREEFESHYGPEGAWAQLFRRHPDYLGTTLARDAADELRYLTIDRWRNATSFDDFKHQYKDQYEALDAACSAFTVEENRIGMFVAS